MKTNLIVLCQHCQNDICEIFITKHYELVANVLQTQWKQCRDKFENINQHVCMCREKMKFRDLFFFLDLVLSHLNKTNALEKLNSIKTTIDERSKDLKLLINERRQNLIANIDDYVENLEHM